MKRKHIPIRVKLQAALFQLGYTEAGASASIALRNWIPLHVQLSEALSVLGLTVSGSHLDHFPALELRVRNPDGTLTPDELDPRYMQWLDRDAHALKTNGTKATSAGSDKNRIAKVRRLRGEVGQNKRKRKWPKRKLQSRNDLRRRPRAGKGCSI